MEGLTPLHKVVAGIDVHRMLVSTLKTTVNIKFTGIS